LLRLLFTAISIFTFGQVTDAEKTLRTRLRIVSRMEKGGVFALNLAQSSLTNWAAGGQNSFAVNGMLSTYANYKKDKSVWVNTLDMGYGVLKQGNTDYRKTGR